MEIWLSWQNNKERFQLPVNTMYSVGSEVLGERVRVSDVGLVNLIGEKGLKEISLSSYFPKRRDSNVDSPVLLNKFEYVEMIEGWAESKKPIRLIITGTPINYAMKIENFDWGESDGTGDIYFSLDLSEYIFIKTENVKNIKGGKANQRKDHKRQSSKIPLKETSHTVKSGESLYKIAKKIYGDGNRWKDIYDVNKNTIGGNPNFIKPNQKLVIPSA